jgi:hypothetical protein
MLASWEPHAIKPSKETTMTVPRKRAVQRQRIETPGGRVILGTFGPEGSNGWDLWVPAVCGIFKFTRGKNGTLIRLVPDSASK